MIENSSTEDLRVAEASVSGLIVGPSRIRSSRVGLGVFSARPFNEGEPVIDFYGDIVYPLEDRIPTRANWNQYYSHLPFTYNFFNQWAVPIGEFTYRRKVYKPYIIPSDFNIAKLINDARYFPDDLDYSRRTARGHRAPNVRFVTPIIMKPVYLKSHECIRIEAMKAIPCGEEIYLDYGDDYFRPEEEEEEEEEDEILEEGRAGDDE